MVIFIVGYPESGKSAMAENMVMEMSDPGRRIYLATMIPYGDEGQARINRHRSMRAGKGFVTVEAPFDVSEALMNLAAETLIEKEPAGSTVLLECVSNLVANELFERHTNPDEAVRRIREDIRRLAGLAGSLVIVSNHYEPEKGFDEETIRYAETLDRVNAELESLADRTIDLNREKKPSRCSTT